MEAIPRLPMLMVSIKDNQEFAGMDWLETQNDPNKQGLQQSISAELKRHITENYSDDPEKYKDCISNFLELQLSAYRAINSPDFEGLNTVKKYYGQLHYMQSRFSFTGEKALNVSIAWGDAFTGMYTQHNSLVFEQTAILFNLGAIHSYLGSLDNRTSEEGTKVSCVHFQCAAGFFQYLADHLDTTLSLDSSQFMLKLFINAMLGQGQECLLEKSMQDNRKHSIIAKISQQVVDYYQSTLNSLNQQEAKDNLGELNKAWFKLITFKVIFYNAVTKYYLGCDDWEQEKYGQGLSYFGAALDSYNEAIKAAKSLKGEHKSKAEEALKYSADVFGGKYSSAKNDNDFIYHERVPDKAALPDIKGASLVKALPFDPSNAAVTGPDIFNKLVPLEAHLAASTYSEEKAKLLRPIIEEVEEKEAVLQQYKRAIDLDPAKLIKVDEEDKLDPALIEHCASLSVDQSPIQKLTDAMKELSNIYMDIDSTAVDTVNLMEDERTECKQVKDVCGKTVDSSEEIEEIQKELEICSDVHKKAGKMNDDLHTAMKIHITNLRIVSEGLDAVKKECKLQNNSELIDDDDKEVIGLFEKLSSKVSEMEVQRESLISQLRSQLEEDDVTSALMTNPGVDAEDLFQEELKKHDTLIGYIRQNLTAQENILTAVTEANVRYTKIRKVIDAHKEKVRSKCSSLLLSCTSYSEAISRCKEGFDFFKELLDRVKDLNDTMISLNEKNVKSRKQIMDKFETKKPPPRPSAPKPKAPTVKPGGSLFSEQELSDLADDMDEFNDPAFLQYLRMSGGLPPGMKSSNAPAVSALPATRFQTPNSTTNHLLAGFKANRASPSSLFHHSVPGLNTRMQMQSTMASPQSGIPLQQPGMHNQQPGMPDQQSSMHYQQAGMPGQQVGMHGQQPGMPGQQPGMPGQQSSMHNQQVGMHGQQTGMPGRQSSMHNQQAGMPGQQVGMPGQQPGMPGQQSGRHGQQLGMPGQQSGMYSQQTGMPGQQFGMPGQQVGMPGQQSSMHNQQAGIHGQQVGMHGQQTGMPGQQSCMHNQQAGLPGQQPGMPGQQSGMHGQQPGIPGQQPGIPGQQPGMHNQQTGMPSQQSSMHSQQTGMFSQQVGMPGQQVGMPGQQVGMPSQQPGMPSQQSGMHNQQTTMLAQQLGMPGQPYGMPGPQSRVPGQKPGVPGQHIAMPSQQFVMPGPQTGMLGQHAGVSGQQPGITNQQVTMPSQQFRKPGEQFGMSGQQPEIHGQQTGMPGQQSGMFGQQVRMPGQQPEMSGQQYTMPSQQPGMHSQQHRIPPQATISSQQPVMQVQPNLSGYSSATSVQLPPQTSMHAPPQPLSNHVVLSGQQHTIISGPPIMSSHISSQSHLSNQSLPPLTSLQSASMVQSVQHTNQRQPTSTVHRQPGPQHPSQYISSGLPVHSQQQATTQSYAQPPTSPFQQPPTSPFQQLPMVGHQQSLPQVHHQPVSQSQQQNVSQTHPVNIAQPARLQEYRQQQHRSHQPVVSQGLQSPVPQNQPLSIQGYHQPSSQPQRIPNSVGNQQSGLQNHVQSGQQQLDSQFYQPSSNQAGVLQSNHQTGPQGYQKTAPHNLPQSDYHQPSSQSYQHPPHGQTNVSVQEPPVSPLHKPGSQPSGFSRNQQPGLQTWQAPVHQQAGMQGPPQPDSHVYPSSSPQLSSAQSVPYQTQVDAQSEGYIVSSNQNLSIAQSSQYSQSQNLTNNLQNTFSSTSPAHQPPNQLASQSPQHHSTAKPSSSTNIMQPLTPSTVGRSKMIPPLQPARPSADLEGLIYTPVPSLQTCSSTTSADELLSASPESDMQHAVQPKSMLVPTKVDDEDMVVRRIEDIPYNTDADLMKFKTDTEGYHKVVATLLSKQPGSLCPLDKEWKELSELQEKHARQQSTAVGRCTSYKNRFQDILPFDQNRIILSEAKDDYINASLIDGISHYCPRFIVAQSPLPSTCGDFWMMVYEQQVNLVVMLVAGSEIPKKCAKYWPEDRNLPQKHGALSVMFTTSRKHESYIERTFTLQHAKRSLPRSLTQLQYTAWPEHGLPASSNDLLSFMRTVNNFHTQQRSLQWPILVHCENGVGHTGTFCAAYACIQELDAGSGIPNILDFTEKMRMKRKYMIREKAQLKFIHDLIYLHATDLLKQRGVIVENTSAPQPQRVAPLATKNSASSFDVFGSSALSSIRASVEKMTVRSDKTQQMSLPNPASSLNNIQLPVTSQSEPEQNINLLIGSNVSDLVQGTISSQQPAEPVGSLTRPDVVSSCNEPDRAAPNAHEPLNQQKNLMVDSNHSNGVDNQKEIPALQPEPSGASLLDELTPESFTLGDVSGGKEKQRFTKSDFFKPRTERMGGVKTENDPFADLDPMWGLKK